MRKTSVGLPTLSEQAGLTVAESVKYTRAGRNAILAALAAGEILGRRVGRRWIVSRASLDQWVTGVGQRVAR